MNVSEAIERFLFAAGLDIKPATLKSYALCLRPLRALDRPIGAVTLDDLRVLYAGLLNRRTRYAGHPSRPELSGGLSIYTLHKHVRVWRRFFGWLLDEGTVTHDPAHKLKRPRLPKSPPQDMTSEDLQRLLDVARGNARDYAIVCFLADTACRVGGLVGLRLGDVDLEARRVHFGERTANALRRYIDEGRGDSGFALRLSPKGARLFIGRRGPLTTAGVYQIIKRLARKAGVRGRCNPHSMRHAWARQAIKRGASLKEVAEILGHESVTTTSQYYAIFLDSELHERHKLLSWLPDEE